MPQNLNNGISYFKEILFTEAQILTVAFVKGIPIPEADKLLYPLKLTSDKKSDEQIRK